MLPYPRRLAATTVCAALLATVAVAAGGDRAQPEPASARHPTSDRAAARAAATYVKAIAAEDIAELARLFAPSMRYDLQFPVRPDGGTTPVVYNGERDILAYYRNGYSMFGKTENTRVRIDQTTDPRVAWATYRQQTELADGSQYVNTVVERIRLDKQGRIAEVVLYENPDLIRAVAGP